MLITAAHFRVRSETGARTWILVLARAATAIVFLAFVVTTLVSEPASIVTLGVILLLSVVVDGVWRRPEGPTVEKDAGAA
jgi:hypothetical protein